jgi:hypothetical protein
VANPHDQSFPCTIQFGILVEGYLSQEDARHIPNYVNNHHLSVHKAAMYEKYTLFNFSVQFMAMFT